MVHHEKEYHAVIKDVYEHEKIFRISESEIAKGSTWDAFLHYHTWSGPLLYPSQDPLFP